MHYKSRWMSGAVMHKLLFLLLMVFMFYGCASQEAGFYKHSKSFPPLEMPPNLINATEEDAFDIPKIAASVVNKPILSNDSSVMMKRDGQLRWLVMKMPIHYLWEQMHDFFVKHNIELVWEDESLGIMETVWVDYYDTQYGKFARDKFRVRIEPGAEDDTIELYVAHRGVQQVLFDGQFTPAWDARPNDAEMEIELLGRILEFLALEPVRVKALLEQAKQQKVLAVLREDEGIPYILLDESYERSWQLVLRAIDRVGNTIISKDQLSGLIRIRRDALDNTVSQSINFTDGKKAELSIRMLQLAGQIKVEVVHADGVVDDSSEAKDLVKQLYEHL